MMLGKIFGEVMEFFPKGLNPFKIQANLIFDLFPGFLIQNPCRFGSWAKTEVCLLGIYLSPHSFSQYFPPYKIFTLRFYR
jgi:hypothetical protein